MRIPKAINGGIERAVIVARHSTPICQLSRSSSTCRPALLRSITHPRSKVTTASVAQRRSPRRGDAEGSNDWIATNVPVIARMGAFAGGGGILRQARPDSRREILLVAAFYGRARKATAQFYPAMATHFEGVWPNAPILNEAERTPKSLCRFIRFQHGQPNLCGTSRSGPAFDRRVN